MKIFGIKIIREKEYRRLLKVESGAKNTLRLAIKEKLPVVLDRTLKGKEITLSRGLLLINSTIENSTIDYKGRYPIKAIYGNIFNQVVCLNKSKSKKSEASP